MSDIMSPPSRSGWGSEPAPRINNFTRYVVRSDRRVLASSKMASDRIAVTPTAIDPLAQNFDPQLAARRVFPATLRLKTPRPAERARCDPSVQVRACPAALSIVWDPDASCGQCQMLPALP